MLTLTQKQADRIVRKWEQRERPKVDAAISADAGFDGGEFSRRAHERHWWQRLERVESRLSVLVQRAEWDGVSPVLAPRSQRAFADALRRVYG